MTIGERIKKRRLELNMSQEELAEKMGYKSKSTINKIEMGINDIVQSKVIKFATILETTSAYLMGWEEIIQQSKEVLDNFDPIQYQKGLKKEEFTNIFKELNFKGQEKVIDYAKDLHNNPLYTDDAIILNAARLRTDREVTEEEKKYDDDIMKNDNF